MNLTGIVTLISVSCSSVSVKPQASSAPSVPVESERDYDALSGVNEIDPENPPLSGVWMSWSDASKMAAFLRKQRIQHDIKVIELERDKEIAEARLNATEEKLTEETTPAKKFWLTWGFPIGIASGLLLGIVIPLSIRR